MSQRVQRFPLNEKGRDFIVGDIHGCVDTGVVFGRELTVTPL